MAFEEDTCAVCGADRPGAKNPIIFCDGQECNVAVHKWCYRVESVPKGDWFCQRCEYKRKNKPTEVICCPEQSGAFRYTTKPGGFMHVVCAMWNRKIDTTIEPYYINKQLLNIEECDICHSKVGLCIKCQNPQCDIKYHVTCAINEGFLTPAKQVSEHYVFYCPTHQPTIGGRRVGSTSTRGARAAAGGSNSNNNNNNNNNATADSSRSKGNLQGQKQNVKKKNNRSRNDDEEDDEEDDEDVDDEEDDNEDDNEDDDDDAMDEDHDDDDDEDSDDGDDSDDDMGLTPRKRTKSSKSSKNNNNKNSKRRTLGSSSSSTRQRTGPIKLFLDDQSESDDDMGTVTTNNNSNSKNSNPSSTSTSNNNLSSTTKSKKESSPALSIKSDSTIGSPSITNKSESNNNINSSPSLSLKSESSPTLPSSTIPTSFRERLEAKRKKTDIIRTPTSPSLPHKKPSLLNVSTTSNTNPPSSSSSSSSLALDLNKTIPSSTTNTTNNANGSNNNKSLSNPLDILTPNTNNNNSNNLEISSSTTTATTTTTSSSSSSSTAALSPLLSNATSLNGSPSIPNKQKLPNKTHLATPSSKPNINNNINNNNNSNNINNLSNINNGNINSRSSISSPSNPSLNNKKLSNASNKPPNTTVIKDLDEIQNDIRAGAQRWPNSNMDNNGLHRNQMMDRKNSLQSGVDMMQLNNMMRSVVNEAMENITARDQNGLQQVFLRLQSANQEIGKMKEELKRLNEFKKNVTDVFEGLNIKIAGRPMSSIEEYINDIKAMLIRSGNISEKDRDRVANFVQDTIKGDDYMS